MNRSITVETKIQNQEVYQTLEEFANFYNYLKRTLLNDLISSPKIDNELRKILGRHYRSYYQIHGRLFNVLYNEAKGDIDSQKEAHKFHKAEIQDQIKKLKKKIKDRKLWLKRGYTKFKRYPLKPHQIRRYKRNIHLFKQKLNKLDDKLQKPFKCSILYGTRDLYKKQWTDEQYKNNHELWKEEWHRKRNYNFYFIGSHDESFGNSLCQYNGETMRITLPHCFEEDYIEFPINFSSDEKTNQQYYSYLHQARENKQAVSYRFLKRENGCWYIQAQFSLINEPEIAYNGTIGDDVNSDLIATTEMDSKGNFINLKNYKYKSEELTTNQTDDLLSKIVLDITKRAKEANRNISIEDLNLKNCKSGNAKDINRKVSLIAYSKFRSKLEIKCIKEKIEIKAINPAFTSIIGKYKYKNFFGISIHNAAALVIARRASDFKDKVPNQIYDILHRGEAHEFEEIRRYRYHWAHWSFINKNLEKCLKKFNSYIIGYSGSLSTGKFNYIMNNLSSRFNPNDYVVHC